MATQTALFDAYRTLAYSSITTSFVAVGTAFTHMIRVVHIINNTDGDMIFSTDGSTSQLFVPAYSFALYDVSTNKELSAPFFFPENTQFYVQYSSAPSKGAVYVQIIYGKGE
jgi:hypothetical protein